MDGSRRTAGLVLLGAIALGLRIATVLVLWTGPGKSLTYEHGQIAENLLDGRGFCTSFLGAEGPTSQQAPFYPVLLAAFYGCFGIGTPAALLAVQLLQCLAGTALVLVVVWLGWSLVPDRRGVGWLAGIGAAVYPTHLYMVTHFQVAVWAGLGLTLLLAVVISPRWRASGGGALLAGCLAGVLLLVEPILVLALPVCAAVFWLGEGRGSWSARFGWQPLGRLALMAGVAALVIAPWLIRNRRVYGEFVFVKSTLGYAFWQGNNPISWGTDKVPKASSEELRNRHGDTLSDMNRALWEARHENLYIDSLLLGPSDYRRLAALSEPERCRLLGQQARQFVSQHPRHYARLCLQRLRYFLLFDETNPKASNRLYRLSTVTWLVLALVGLAASYRRWRAFWPTYAIFALVTLFHTLVIVSARFRIPIEPLSMVWAALALAPLAVHVQRRPEIQVWRPGQRAQDPLEQERTREGSQRKPLDDRRAA
jgi:hypothetical protein